MKANNITTVNGKTVATLVNEYLKSGASTGNRIKTKGTKLKYKTITGKGYVGLLKAYVLVKTDKESTKQLLTAPFHLGNNTYYKKQLAELPLGLPDFKCFFCLYDNQQFIEIYISVKYNYYYSKLCLN